jgi:chromosome segregation ATPase
LPAGQPRDEQDRISALQKQIDDLKSKVAKTEEEKKQRDRSIEQLNREIKILSNALEEQQVPIPDPRKATNPALKPNSGSGLNRRNRPR